MATDQAQVGELVVSLRAEVGLLRKDLDRARGQFRQATRKIQQEAAGIQASLKSIKEPFSNIAQLTNAMGTAFGGAASKATGLATGIISSFAAGGLAGLAMSAFAGIVVNVQDALTKAGTAAEEASKKAAEAATKEAARRREVLTALRNEIRLQQLKADGKDPGLVALLEDEQQARGKAAIAAEKQRTVEKDLARLEKQASEERAAALAQAPNGLLQSTGTLPTITPQIEELRKQKKALEDEQRFYLEQAELLKVQQSGAGAGAGGPPKSGAAGRAGVPLKAMVPTGDPFATEESLAAYLKAGVAQQTREDEAKARLAAQREGLKNARAEAKGLADDLEETGKNAEIAGGLIEANFIDPLVNGTFQIQDALANILKDIAALAAKAVLRLFLTAITGGPGGLIPLAEGGRVSGPGGPKDDRAGAFALSDGEFVVNAAAARRVGYDTLEAVNGMRASPPSVSNVLNLAGHSLTVNGKVGGDTLARFDELLTRGLVEQKSAVMRAMAALVKGQTGLNPVRT